MSEQTKILVYGFIYVGFILLPSWFFLKIALLEFFIWRNRLGPEVAMDIVNKLGLILRFLYIDIYLSSITRENLIEYFKHISSVNINVTAIFASFLICVGFLIYIQSLFFANSEAEKLQYIFWIVLSLLTIGQLGQYWRKLQNEIQ